MKRLQLIISALMGDSWVWFALSVDCTCGKMEWISFLPQSTEEKKKNILENRVHDITLKNACYCNFVVIDLIIVFVTVRASKNKYGGVFI